MVENDSSNIPIYIYRYAFKYMSVFCLFSVIRVLIFCSSSAVPSSSCASTRVSLRVRYRQDSMNFIAQPIAGTQAIGVTVFTSVCAPIESHPPSCSDVDVLLTAFESLLVLIHPYLSPPVLVVWISPSLHAKNQTESHSIQSGLWRDMARKE